MGAAEALGSGDVSLPKSVRDMLVRGRVSWLRNEDVVDLLHNYKQYKFRVSKEPPVKPPGARARPPALRKCRTTKLAVRPRTPPCAQLRAPARAGGAIFLFNRKTVRFFRKDGHNWRKKSDGKTVRETHEKLKARRRRRCTLSCPAVSAVPAMCAMCSTSHSHKRCRCSLRLGCHELPASGYGPRWAGAPALLAQTSRRRPARALQLAAGSPGSVGSCQRSPRGGRAVPGVAASAVASAVCIPIESVPGTRRSGTGTR